MHREIGQTGVNVYPIGLGAWQLSNENRPANEDGVRLLCDSIANGVEFIDTADCYAKDDNEFGHNERLVARCLGKTDINKVRIATKVGIRRPRGQWIPDGRPQHILNSCDNSLKRLGVEQLFLYQLHRPDPEVPLLETIGAMASLQSTGKVAHLGLSNVTLTELQNVLAVHRIETVQNCCNPWNAADVGNGLLTECRANNLTYLPYHPVGSKYRHNELNQQSGLREIANRYGVSTYRLLLAWSLAQGPHVIPIPGATKLTSVLDNLAATEISIETTDLATLTALGA